MAGENTSGAVLLVAGIPVLTLGLVFSLLLFGGSAGAACNPPTDGSTSVTIDPATVPAGPIAGYSGEQLVNAAYILKAGADLGLSVRDQTIGVMTAMGESSLVNVNCGDDLHGVTNPDGTLTCSLGLFQQQWCLGWGTQDDVMDPYISATKFFTAMMKVENRDSLEPTGVAHRTQRNANPFHYAKYWDAAVAVVEQLSGVDTGLSAGNGNQVCTGEGGTTLPGQVNDGGWATPGAGPVKSQYGMRYNPGQINHGQLRLHAGTDLAAGSCNGPIWAACDTPRSVTTAAPGSGHSSSVVPVTTPDEPQPRGKGWRRQTVMRARRARPRSRPATWGRTARTARPRRVDRPRCRPPQPMSAPRAPQREPPRARPTRRRLRSRPGTRPSGRRAPRPRRGTW